MNNWKCYLCGHTEFSERDGQVRDAPALKILQCTHCGLVTLSSLSHIQAGFYEESHMHGADVVPMEHWLRDTDWDDQSRVDMLKPLLANKKFWISVVALAGSCTRPSTCLAPWWA